MSDEKNHIKRKLKEIYNPSWESILDLIRGEGERLSRDEIIQVLDQDRRLYLHYTPNLVASLMAKLVETEHPNEVADITCGLANILAHCDFAERRIGYEIDPGIVEISSFLNPEIDIKLQDSRRLEGVKYSAIVSTVPWDLKPAGLTQALVEKAWNLLSDDGILALYIHNSYLTSRVFETQRKAWLSAKAVRAVIEVPRLLGGIGVDGSVIVLQKDTSGAKCFFGRLTNDVDAVVNQFKQGKGDFYVDYDQLNPKRLDRKYYSEENRSYRGGLVLQETKKLGDLSKVFYGLRLSNQGTDDGIEGVLVLRSTNVSSEGLNLSKARYIARDSIKNKSELLRPGDIILNTVSSSPAIYFYKQSDPEAVIAQPLMLLRSKEGAYIHSYLQTNDGQEHLLKMLEMERLGSVLPQVPGWKIKEIDIPIIPMSDLNQVSNESIDTASRDELKKLENSLWILANKHRGNDDLPLTVAESGVHYGGSSALEMERLFQSLESTLTGRWFADRFNRIENRLANIETKVDAILEIVQELNRSFQSIRQIPRDEESILRRLNQAIDEFNDKRKAAQETLDLQVEEVKQWFIYWDQLDEMSKHFLPSAEFLFDKISTIENADYSPFVVQYCRALENELLKKLFESYHSYLKEVKNEDEIEALASPHFEKRDTCTRFATLVRKDDPKYTMGDMQFIMNMMKPNGSTFKKSLLLQDFYEFILYYYRKNILEKEYLALIERITQEYRNKSAHPYIIALDQAQECRKLIQLGLNQLFESRKTS